MNKILQSTPKGQITIPKKWRDSFGTQYYSATLENNKITIIPLPQQISLEAKLENAWQEYKRGDFIDGDELMKQYGL